MSPSHRSRVLKLLTEACELEHGLACAYLYAAMSLKQRPEEGLGWALQQRTRLWAAQLYFVAGQEMLHLAQAWNLITAIGGTPYYLRPNYPQSSRFYPLHLPLSAEPFSLTTLDRFIAFERPASITAPPSPDAPYKTVGELYGMIAELLGAADEAALFIGDPRRQVGPSLVDFPQIVTVTDRASALAAVALIVHQGEGLDQDRDDCHYGVFRRLRADYIAALHDAGDDDAAFAPVRPCLSNPVAAPAVQWAGAGANPLTDSRTSASADLCDSVYGLMLRLLQYVFDNADDTAGLLKTFATTSLLLMTTVIKPFGEALSQLPAGPDYADQTAGPGFVLARHIPLPRDPRSATILARERLSDLSLALDGIVTAGGPTPVELLGAATNLRKIAASANAWPI